MKDGSLEYLYLYACLHCKLLLIFNNLEGYMFFFLVIISFEHLAKRASSQNSYYLVFIGNSVSNCDLGVTLAICKIS